MSFVWNVVLLLQVTVIGVTSAASYSAGNVYPVAFMNITTDRAEEGFVQLYGCANNESQIRVTALPNSINDFAVVGTLVGRKWNLTQDFNDARFSSDVQTADNTEIDQLGVISASSSLASFIGVKSDRGSTDAFLALPLMRGSTEFFVAGWPYSAPFYASCVIVPALSGTCVEIYRILDNQKYFLVGEGSLSQFDTLRYYADFEIDPATGEQIEGSRADMTGFYINSTKPVQVICGHECANVPDGVPFCDHISEQIPPINQLGRFHVVPPIYGRAPNAGYVVRVVSTDMGTAITAFGTTVWRDRGAFVQFNTSSFQAIVIECSKPCLVMQYNKGRRAAGNDVPTDPFMTLVVPSDRFTGGAGFATPNYCNVAKDRINFDNWVSVVTYAPYRDNILFDGQPILQMSGGNTWDLTTVVGYAIIGFQITHDFHYVTNAPGTTGSFAVYPYGHSILSTSSSAYGFSANYNITGDPVTDVWQQSEEEFNQYLNNISKNSLCSNETKLIAPILDDPDHVSFPFYLTTSFAPVAISDYCIQNYYNASIWKQLSEFTHLINQWICSTANCSYLQGWGVALNYNTLSVQFLKDSQGNYNGLYITVEMIADLETTASEFGACRAEIKNFMTSFVNWPSRTLFPTMAPAGCPWPLNFQEQAFVVGGLTCTVI